MYVVVLLALLALGGALVARGKSRGQRRFTVPGVLLLVGTPAFYAFMSFWGELLWFEELKQLRRFWTAVFAIVGTAAAGALVAGGLVQLVTIAVRGTARRARWIATGFAVTMGILWGVFMWDVALRRIFGADTGVRDPILGLDTGFYLFSLPLYDALYGLLLASSLLALMMAAWAAFGRAMIQGRAKRATMLAPAGLRLIEDVDRTETTDNGPPASGEERRRAAGAEERGRACFYTAAGVLALVLAAGRVLSVYHLLYSASGIVEGPGWTDVHVRLPAHLVTGAVLAFCGVTLVVPRARRALESWVLRRRRREGAEAESDARTGPVIGVLAGTAIAVWLIGLVALPALFQWLKVTPNELALERPYLENNIAFTRRGFALDKVEVREFDPRGRMTDDVIGRNEDVLSEVRLWDPQALDQVLEQFQEIRLYYELTGVDIDRYDLDPRYRQVMVAPREMETGNLPRESRTFVNRHFKYTHGYGLAMTPVSDFTPDGLPRLIVRDMPPVSEHPAVALTRPEVYYGERTNDFVVVNSKAAEFDYPSGDQNVYTHYAGSGGVALRDGFRKLVFGWKVGGTRFLFSEYPKDDSRIMFRRNVRERVAKLAPFLELDVDPYIVLVNGRLKWIVDGYTTSSYYPYSEPFSGSRDEPVRAPEAATREGAAPQRREGLGTTGHLPRINYVRNSAKAVVDAYDGSVAIYTYEPEDPIIRAWSRAFPGLLQAKEEMPPELRAHVRYPEEMLHIQGLVYSKYHMTDPEVFYNQEDLWVRATDKHYGEVRPVTPYYVMWQPPGSQRAEFITMQPYTPKERQVLIGWIAGMCDPENYGRLLAYRFPKDKWVLGPQQVDTKIDQDPQLSAQLTLWDQLGKRVIRGNVLAIPIEDTILYVEPIYLQAQAAAYPELRMVVVMNRENMSFAPSLKEALEGLVAPGLRRPEGPRVELGAEVLARAQQHFDEYVRLMGAGRFIDAAGELEKLREALAGRGPGPGAGELPAR